MMFNYPFLGFRNKYYPYKTYNYPIYHSKYNSSNDIFENKPANHTLEELSHSTTKSNNEHTAKTHSFLSILGIRLYFDDLIILALLFFLYNEGVKDDWLFICLILLLLS